MMKLLPLVVLVLLARMPAALALGPSFDCTQVETPAAQIICASPDLSAIDVAFVQAYYALRYQVGPAGWADLRQEDLDFFQSVLDQCNIPASGPPVADTNTAGACLGQLYRRQRQVWLSRLQGAASVEANRPVADHLALQRQLQTLGFLPASDTIDGIYGTDTRAAITSFQQSKGLSATGFMDDETADALLGRTTTAANTGRAEPAPIPPADASSTPSAGDALNRLKSLAMGLLGQDRSALTDSSIAALVSAQLASAHETKCMNVTKIKTYANNLPLTLADQSADMSNPFPLVFAEEAFVPWNSDDQLVMYLLMSGGFIAVHRGGYERSVTEKGSPGAVYQPRNQGDLDAIFAAIKQYGAVIDLTRAGAAQGVWDPDNGFCAAGDWTLTKVEGWTTPAADSTGVIVTHIQADEEFDATRLGRATRGINPLGLALTRTETFKAAKYNDGWRVVGTE